MGGAATQKEPSWHHLTVPLFLFTDWFSPVETRRNLLIRKYDPAGQHQAFSSATLVDTSWTFLPIDSIDPPSWEGNRLLMWITAASWLSSCITDVSVREDNHAGRLRKQQEGWQIKSQKHWHPGSFGCPQEHFHTHTLACQNRTGEWRAHPFVQSFGWYKTDFCSEGSVSCLQSRELQWMMMNIRMVSALRALAFSQRNERKLAESDPTCWFNKSHFCLLNVCISSIKTAIKTNFIARLFSLEPKNECELLYVSLFQLSKFKSKLLHYYSNRSVKLWVNQPSRFILNVFWIFSGSAANVCNRNSREKRKSHLWFELWRRWMPLLCSIRTVVMNICAVHIIGFISSIPKS